MYPHAKQSILYILLASAVQSQSLPNPVRDTVQCRIVNLRMSIGSPQPRLQNQSVLGGGVLMLADPQIEWIRQPRRIDLDDGQSPPFLLIRADDLEIELDVLA